MINDHPADSERGAPQPAPDPSPASQRWAGSDRPGSDPSGDWAGDWAQRHGAARGSTGQHAVGQQPAGQPSYPPHGPAGPASFGTWPVATAAPPTTPSWPPAPPGRPVDPAVNHGAPPAPPARRGGPARTLVIALVAGLLGGLLGGAVGHMLANGSGGSIGVLGQPLPPADPNAPLGPIEAVAQRVLPSVVQLRVSSGRARGEGSGMLLSADGLILTNNHVVDAAANGGTITVVFQDGATAPAQLVGHDPSSDVAVIRAQGVSGRTPIELGNSESVRVGQQVVAIGSPLGLGGSVTTGIVSATDRAVNVGAQNGANDATVLNAIQTDAAINPGNSGGPLVDLQGRVVGINSAIATTGGGNEGGNIGVGFSIPINAAQRIAKELEATGRATRAVLGINVAAGGDDDLGGAVIGQVTPGSPAEAAGLKSGEVITRVDDRVITGGDELVAAIRDHAPGAQVTLTVNGRQVVVTLAGQTG